MLLYDNIHVIISQSLPSSSLAWITNTHNDNTCNISQSLPSSSQAWNHKYTYNRQCCYQQDPQVHVSLDNIFTNESTLFPN